MSNIPGEGNCVGSISRTNCLYAYILTVKEISANAFELFHSASVVKKAML